MKLILKLTVLLLPTLIITPLSIQASVKAGMSYQKCLSAIPDAYSEVGAVKAGCAVQAFPNLPSVSFRLIAHQ